MVRYARLQYEIDIPEDVTLELDDSVVTIKGELGEVTRDFAHTRVQITKNENAVQLESMFPRKKEKAMIGTVQAHIKNAIMGVQYGYRYYLKIVFSHFPIRVQSEGNKVKIENLYGGRKPLYADVLPGVNVRVDDDDVIVEGANKDYVGQTAANIQEITRQRGARRKSPKTFMDGIFIYDKEFQKEIPDDAEISHSV